MTMTVTVMILHHRATPTCDLSAAVNSREDLLTRNDGGGHCHVTATCRFHLTAKLIPISVLRPAAATEAR